MRRISAEKVASVEVAGGCAIGGLSVGEPKEDMYELTELVCDILPKDKPRYLMGVGTPENILEGISQGVDMFDCVMPTRNGRNAMLFTKNGIMNMKNKKWAEDFSPIEEDGASYVDQEYLAAMVASLHNLAFYLWLVGEARKHILQGDFPAWKTSMVGKVMQRL